MKKLNFLLAGLAGLTLASCSQDDLGLAVPGSDATVTINLTTPQLGTRADGYAYGDGSTATHLHYAVYDLTNLADGVSPSPIDTYTSEDETLTNKMWSKQFNLVSGHTYGFLFWADAPHDASGNKLYNVNLKEGTLTVDYTVENETLTANNEAHDAFFAYEKITVNGNLNQTIKLNRPLAQINIGTDDYDAAEAVGYIPTVSSVTVKDVYNSFNFFTGEYGGKETVTFTEGAIDRIKTFPVTHPDAKKKYEYLGMVYALVDQAVVDIDFTYGEEIGQTETRNVTSVPVQSNYRTNIYGSVLTSTADLTVEIEPAFGTPDTDYELVDVPAGKIIYDNKSFDSLAEVFEAITTANDSDPIVYLGEGEFTGKGLSWPAVNLSIYGATGEKTRAGASNVVSFITDLSNQMKAGSASYKFSNIGLNVENGGSSTSMGFREIGDITFNGSEINGEYHAFAGNSTFNNCTFNYMAYSDNNKSGRYSIWAEGNGHTIFNNCYFNNSFTGKAILIYGDNNYEMGDVDVINCTFQSAKDDGKAAIEIHSEKFVSGGSLRINNAKWNSDGYIALWRELNNTSK